MDEETLAVLRAAGIDPTLFAQQDATANPSNTQGGGVIEDGSLGLLGLGLDFTPGVGDVKALFHDAPRDFREGRPISGTVAALSAVPILGIPLDVVRKLPSPSTVGRAIGNAGSVIGDTVGDVFSAFGRGMIKSPATGDAHIIRHADGTAYRATGSRRGEAQNLFIGNEDNNNVLVSLASAKPDSRLAQIARNVLPTNVTYYGDPVEGLAEDFFGLPGSIAKSKEAGLAFDREMNILDIDDLFPDDVSIRAMERAGVPRLLAQNPVDQGPQSAQSLIDALLAERDELRALDDRLDSSIARGATGPGNAGRLSRRERHTLKTHDPVDKSMLDRRYEIMNQVDDIKRLSDDNYAAVEYARLVDNMATGSHRNALSEAMGVTPYELLDRSTFDERIALTRALPKVPRERLHIEDMFK